MADPIVQLGQAIAGRGRCLVLLDNYEQIAKFAEDTLGRWLDAAPLAQFIVTTREVLGIVGEEILAVPPLDVEDAVQLFLKRARAAHVGFAPGPDDLTAIRQLVGVLDCLPLAIELAAARVRVMPPRTLLVRMKDRFDVLLSNAGRRDRQATLRATFDWSWELLGEIEKRALARLSVFKGGFTLESAAAIDLHPVQGRFGAVDVVQWLLDKSLVRQTADERFDLPESIREYAAQHLRTPGRFEGSGPDSEAEARACHWRYFARAGDQVAVADRCSELSNFVSACRAAVDAGDGPSAVGCLVSAWAALRLTGPYRAAGDLAAQVARTSNLSEREKSWVHLVSGDVLDILGEVDAARRHVEQGLSCAERAGDFNCKARLLIVLGSRQGFDGKLEDALTSLEEAHRLGEQESDASLQTSALIVLGRLMEHQSRFEEARSYNRRALALAVANGDRRTEGGVLGNLGGIHHDLGELDEARNHYERALVAASEVGDRKWAGNGHCNLGLLYQEQGKSTEARAQFDLALSAARELGHARLENVVLCNLGILLTAEGRLAEAGQHLTGAVNGAMASADRRAEGQARGYLALVLAKQGLMEDARAMAERGESLLIASADSLSLALLLCDSAEIEFLASERKAAERALGRATRIADEIGCGPNSELRRRLASIELVASVS